MRRNDILNKPNCKKEVVEHKRLVDSLLPLYGYTTETINLLLVPMFVNKKEALGSMGNDAPLALLSPYQPLVYEYFKQLFAQVTNPPIDPFREKIVMSLQCPIGPEANLLKPSAEQVHRIWLPNPVLSISDTEILKRLNYRGWKSAVIDMTFPRDEGVQGFHDAVTRVCLEGEQAANNGFRILILSDRNAGDKNCPISALLALGALHHHLIETRNRMKVGIVVESAEIREVHQVCVALGYGADALCPYLVFELAAGLRDEGVLQQGLTDHQIYLAYSQAIDTGISKVMAKMGISTLQSYKGAQIFEAVGLGTDVIDKCFRGTQSRLGGVTLDILASETIDRHHMAYGARNPDTYILRNPGIYHWRNGGERHINEPESIAALQEAASGNNKNAYERFRDSTLQSVEKCTLRGQLQIVTTGKKIDLSEVESAAEIVKRFATGAMSFGSISLEAHETLAITMNRIGGKSNTGEGGENPDRYLSMFPKYSPHLCENTESNLIIYQSFFSFNRPRSPKQPSISH